MPPFGKQPSILFIIIAYQWQLCCIITTPLCALAAPKFCRTATSYGVLRRGFRLPDMVSVKAIGAEFADGVLRTTLPFDTEKVTKQYIEIH